MIKASDLIKQQKEREDKKYITFEKIYTHIEKKILINSNSNLYYTWFEVPQLIIGYPTYSIKECIEFIENKLRENGFTVTTYSKNIIYIEWFPK